MPTRYGDSVTYRERLHIPWWWALIGALFIASIAVAVVAYLPLPLGLTLSGLAAVAVVLGLIAYSRTLLTVDDTAFRAGRNVLEGRYIGGATPFDGHAARQAVGVDADHRAFLFTRPFVPAIVRVDVDDAADPHPYWLVSTRHPQELARAIEALRVAS